MGGAHASMDAEDILKNNPSVDIIVRGEGELTFKLLLNCIAENRSYTSLEGIVFRDGNIIQTNPKRKMIPDINELPYPARDLLNLEVYKKINSENLLDCKNTPVLTMMTSRGCPFDCVFCSTKVVWERKWRQTSPDRVVNEMKSMIKSYQVKEIAIYDDQFLASKKRVHEICDLIIAKKLDITINVLSGISGWLLDEDLLKKMKKAGFYKLSLSIEVGNEKTLKFIKKPVNLGKMIDIIKICHKLGFWVQSNFIIGFPFETKEDIDETIRYATKCGVDYALFLIAQPYAGAELYEIYSKENMLHKSTGNTNSIVSANYDTKFFSAKEIQEMRDSATRDFLINKFIFYLHPVHFFKYLFPKIFFMKGGIRYAFKVFFVIIREKLLKKSRLVPIENNKALSQYR